jgi:hypothetical protein
MNLTKPLLRCLVIKYKKEEESEEKEKEEKKTSWEALLLWKRKSPDNYWKKIRR